MMKTLILALCAMTMLAAFSPARADSKASIGNYTFLKGSARVTHSGEVTQHSVTQGAPVYAGDIIETAASSAVSVRFIDDTEISLGQSGSLTIDDYVYDPESTENNKARYQVLKTAFSYVSGKISHKANPDVTIGLDFGSIGIRGTKLFRGMRDGECWIYLEEGLITVSNEGGSVNIEPQQMTRLSSKTAEPLNPAPWSTVDASWIKQEIGR